jgi:hypothetical protein
MRKVICGGACSLDGFVAGPAGALDWLHFSKDIIVETAGICFCVLEQTAEDWPRRLVPRNYRSRAPAAPAGTFTRV